MSKKRQSISFIILSPFYDSGIKSLGSKCLLTVKRKKIIEKQITAIEKFCTNKRYEIILVNSIENNRTSKFIENKKLNIIHKFVSNDNINYGGSLIEGLKLAKYDKIYSIESGLVFSTQALDLLNTNESDICIGCIHHKHQQNEDLDIGCVVSSDNKVSNIFFGLDNKYIGINRFNNFAKQFIINNFGDKKNGNKFIFELINSCVTDSLICHKKIIKSKDIHLIFNKKSIQQYIG